MVLNRATDGCDDIGQRIRMKQRQNTLRLVFPVATFLEQAVQVFAPLRSEFRIASLQNLDLLLSVLGRSMLWIVALVAARASQERMLGNAVERAVARLPNGSRRLSCCRKGK